MIVWDDGTKKQRVYEMWEDNFHDPVSYANFYFNEVYGKNEVLLNEEMSADENIVKGIAFKSIYTSCKRTASRGEVYRWCGNG